MLIIGIKCEMKGVARQPLWEECNCNLEASEFFAETHLDKSLLKKASCKGSRKTIISRTCVSMWTTVFQAVTSKGLHFSR